MAKKAVISDVWYNVKSSVVLNKRIEGTMLTPLKKTGRSKHYESIYLVRCDCGKEKEILLKTIGPEKVRSCGCLRMEFFMKKVLPAGIAFSRSEARRKMKQAPNDGWFQKGRTPWNKGKTGYRWHEGKIKVKYPDGRVEYIDAEDPNQLF